MAPGEVLEGAIARTALVDHVGKSGATLERMTLADGRRVVVKRVTPETDLTLSLFGDTVAAEYLLWESGGLDRLPTGVGHAIVDAWTEGADTTVLVMRDLGDAVLGWDDRLDAPGCRRVIQRVAALHRAYLGDPPSVVRPLVPALELFAPQRIGHLAREGESLLAAAVRGWDCFADPAVVPLDVSDAVFALLEDATPMATALSAGPVTLVHGDLATVNLAVTDDEVVLLDWAMPLATAGAVDVARLLVGCAHVLDLEPDAILDDYRDAAGPAYDDASLQVALLSALCWLGWNKALDVVERSDERVRARERASLDWWVARARGALEGGVL